MQNASTPQAELKLKHIFGAGLLFVFTVPETYILQGTSGLQSLRHTHAASKQTSDLTLGFLLLFFSQSTHPSINSSTMKTFVAIIAVLLFATTLFFPASAVENSVRGAGERLLAAKKAARCIKFCLFAIPSCTDPAFYPNGFKSVQGFLRR